MKSERDSRLFVCDGGVDDDAGLRKETQFIAAGDGDDEVVV